MAEKTTTEVAELLPSAGVNAFSGATAFQDAQRMAGLLVASKLAPEMYRGKENLPNAVIALELAQRIGASPLMVMQNLYIVHGKPAWSSQLLISCVNASRKFTPLRYRATGTRGQDSWGCVAWARDKEGELLESPEVTMGMAKAEGWVSKSGSKWQTMPELMLRYRAATLFARLYAPELTMGIQTVEEVIDITPTHVEQIGAGKPSASMLRQRPVPAQAEPAEHGGEEGKQQS